MIQIEIPGRETLRIEHVALDYNGTLAEDGRLIPGAAELLSALREKAKVHILTADTYGTVRAECAAIADTVDTFPSDAAAAEKRRIVSGLSGQCVCFGNGYNDAEMFDAAALSVAVLQKEGMYAGLLLHADVLVTDIRDGLSLLLFPNRLRATLRG